MGNVLIGSSLWCKGKDTTLRWTGGLFWGEA